MSKDKTSKESVNSALRKTDVIRNFPWVFWVTVERRKWFKMFWKSRGANFLNLQIFCFYISIGMPWKKSVLKKAEINYPLKGLNHFLEINKSFNKWYHIHIGKGNFV
jgi:hypothetical protein